MINVGQFFHIDNLTWIMILLVGFVGLSVISFSSRYLKGDRKQGMFFVNLFTLLAAVFVMVSADQLLLLFAAWGISNLFLVRLMLHKPEWEAARQSALLAAKNFLIGFLLIGIAFFILYYSTGYTSIQSILYAPINQTWLVLSTSLLFLGAMTQSALWPFHRWLTSSLNSPTPVSAIMHAGLVNGGGFLLVRFAPLFFEQPLMLTLIFALGIATALLGTLWKLMQTDVKRMLACSTMGQMGFMMAQCGLGLFPAAVAHLCWHGLFKAYLFLGSGSAAQEKRLDLEYPPKLSLFLLALMCGTVGAYVFALTSGKNIFAGDTTLFLIIIALMTGTQFALPLVRGHYAMKIPLALICTSIMGAVYGMSIHLVEASLVTLDLAQPQALNVFHIVALIALILAWLFMVFKHNNPGEIIKNTPELMHRVYVFMLNTSQPHPKTITTCRKQYEY